MFKDLNAYDEAIENDTVIKKVPHCTIYDTGFINYKY